MPRILRSVVPWLVRPAPGGELFTTPTNSKTKKSSRPGPRRTVAHRGSEVFVAVGNQIRWTDLALVHQQWREQQERRRQQYHTGKDPENQDAVVQCYKTLKVAVWEDICQLSISPNGKWMAILTAHTVHMVLLPNASNLRTADITPIRVKTYTLGPTCHVLSQSPVISAVWHPLGVLGGCLVTVTAEAIARVWELDADNRWSFNAPTLLVDLKRLADGLPSTQSEASLRLSANQPFSPDSFEMEVAAACFGGPAAADQDPWAPMTLWIAMRNGAVYALCPLLPAKWTLPAALRASLSASVRWNMALARNDGSMSQARLTQLDSQLDWITDVESQEPLLKPSAKGGAGVIEIFSRPAKCGPVPSLQGPFEVELWPEADEEDPNILLTDICVVAAKVDGLADAEVAADHESTRRLSLGIVCLLANTGRVYVLLDMEGVEGRWVSRSKRADDDVSDIDEIVPLLNFESTDTVQQKHIPHLATSWPLFTPDPFSEYAVLVTHLRGATHLSFSPWVEPLEKELQHSGTTGLDVRLDVLLHTRNSTRQQLLDWSTMPGVSESAQDYSASIMINSPPLEYLLLTAADGRGHGVLLDPPHNEPFDDWVGLEAERTADDYDDDNDVRERRMVVRRLPYEPSPFFSIDTPLLAVLEGQSPPDRSRPTPPNEVRVSLGSLRMLTEAHRVVSEHTHLLGSAVAELFRQCERMQEEFQDQIRNVNEVLYRVENVVDHGPSEDEDEEDDDAGNDEDGGGRSEGDESVAQEAARGSQTTPSRGESGIQRRLEAAQLHQAELVRRFDALQRRVAISGGRALSETEESWKRELEELETRLFPPEAAAAAADDGDDQGEESDGTVPSVEQSIWKRHEEIKRLTSQLVADAKAARDRDRDREPAPSADEDRASAEGGGGGGDDGGYDEEHDASTFASAEPPAGASPPMAEVRVSLALRKKKVEQVMLMLERESALVDATTDRLERLSVF
ncbi:MAG: hypothetical protein M1826_001212 [Phylliscum demangeonii]|nr:MAG: hypothetical protein M1826_001212 [Phylliscum demangeonii]